MKVTAWYRDGSFWELELADDSLTPMAAIAKAKEQVPEQELVEEWEVEEDFL